MPRLSAHGGRGCSCWYAVAASASDHGLGDPVRRPVSSASSSSASRPGCQSPLMLKAVLVVSIRSSSQNSGDSARAISTSPVARVCAGSALGPSSVFGWRRQRTSLGDYAVCTGDAHRSSVQRATVDTVSRQTLSKRLEKGSGDSQVEGGLSADPNQVFVTKPCPTLGSGRRPTPEGVDEGTAGTEHHGVRCFG
jgi:hypothetical protein